MQHMGSPFMPPKLPYTPPQVFHHKSPAEYPAWAKDAVQKIRQESDNASLHDPILDPLAKAPFEPPAEPNVAPQFVTVVDTDRRYVEVSDSFCQLLGYRREDLLGQQYDIITAPDTNDIPAVFNLFSKLGYMHGLWMLVSRSGARILVRYKSWLRPDSRIEGHMELIGSGY